MILETCRVWFRTKESVAQVISDDWGVVESAQAGGSGILFLTPHLGSFEITARYAAERIPLTVMFRPPRKAFLQPLVESARSTSKLNAVAASGRGVRALLKSLRHGHSVGILPDHAPSIGDGVWVPYFGRLAYTMTLPGKLAAQTHVPVILAAGERLPRGHGWRVHFTRLPAPLPEDAQAQAEVINKAMEALIHRFPEQYLWSYNRYKVPPGAPPKPAD